MIIDLLNGKTFWLVISLYSSLEHIRNMVPDHQISNSEK